MRALLCVCNFVNYRTNTNNVGDLVQNFKKV